MRLGASMHLTVERAEYAFYHVFSEGLKRSNNN